MGHRVSGGRTRLAERVIIRNGNITMETNLVRCTVDGCDRVVVFRHGRRDVWVHGDPEGTIELAKAKG